MDFKEFKEIVFAKAREMGIEDFELYYTAAESTNVVAFQHEINEFSSSLDGGACFRCIVGGKMGYASTEELSAEQAASVVVRAAENAAVLESQEQVFLAPGGQVYEEPVMAPYELPKTEELIHGVLTTQEKLYAADPRTVDGCQTQGFAERNEIAICNSKGLDLHYSNATAGLITAAVVSENGEMADSFEIKLGKLDTIDTDALTRKAVDSAIRKLGGEVAPTAVCPVVFDPKAMSDLLSTFRSVFSSESAQKGLSRLGDKEGEMIASPVVTLVDDPFYKDSPMPMPFDAEGSPTHTKCVIENGRLTTLLYNLKTAAVAGKKTTGNGSKAGYDAPVNISPFTMYLAPGTLSEEELLAKAGNGVFINAVEGLHAGANPVSGDFSLQSAGFLIENGKKTKAVKSFTVAGNFYDLLKKITDVGSNLTLPFAMGKTAFGAPSVLVDHLSIAGK